MPEKDSLHREQAGLSLGIFLTNAGLRGRGLQTSEWGRVVSMNVFCLQVLRKERNEHVVVFWDTHSDEPCHE